MAKKICVYTCITGDYDAINEFPEFKEKNIDYYLFTNNQNINSNFWNVVHIDEKLDNIRTARKIKILGHEILKKYDITIWLDGAMRPRKPISKFLSECCDTKNYSLISFKHPNRDCAYDEAKACVIHGRDNKEVIIKEMEYLKTQNYPEHNGLIESAVLVRKNNDSTLNKTMNDWFDMILKYSYRDQLSFNYVAYKNKLHFQLLNMQTFDNQYFYRLPHKKEYDKRLIKYRVYFTEDFDLKNYKYENDFSGDYEKKDDKYIISIKAPTNGEIIKIKLDNLGGIIINSINVEGVNLDNIEYIHNIIHEDKITFLGDNPTLIIHGNYKKNNKIIIKIDMNRLKEEDYLKIIDNLFYKLRDLENNNKKINQEKDNLHQETQKLKQEIINTKKELEQYFIPIETKYKKITNSIFWKITFPVRLIRRKILHKRSTK